MSPKKTKAEPAEDISEILDEAPPAPAVINFSPFDSKGGNIRTSDFSPGEMAAIESMPDNQRSAFFRMVEAAKNADELSHTLQGIVSDITAKMREENTALEALAAQPNNMTHQLALKQAIAAHNGTELEKPRPANPKFQAAVDTVQAELVSLRQMYASVTANLKNLTRIRGEAIADYIRSMPPVTPESVTRQYLARSGAERTALAKGEITPEPEPVHQWPIEAAFAARKNLPKKRTYVGSTKATAPIGINHGTGARPDPKPSR